MLFSVVEVTLSVTGNCSRQHSKIMFCFSKKIRLTWIIKPYCIGKKNKQKKLDFAIDDRPSQIPTLSALNREK